MIRLAQPSPIVGAEISASLYSSMNGLAALRGKRLAFTTFHD